MAVDTNVTQVVIDAIKAAAPASAEVIGAYDAQVNAWTWLLTVPNPTEDFPDATIGISRQFVSTDDVQVPDDEYVHGLVTEMVTTAMLSIAQATSG